MRANDLGKSVIFPIGKRLKSDYFKGTVWLNMLTPSGTACPIGNVTFEPGCRNNWHKHAGGQILLVTGGRGYYQEWGKPAQSFIRERWSVFLPTSNTGMVLPKTAGLSILLLRSILQKALHHGWSRYPTKNTIS